MLRSTSPRKSVSERSGGASTSSQHSHTNTKMRVASHEGGTAHFYRDALPAHVELALQLDVGQEPLPLVVLINFIPDYPGLGVLPPDVQAAARVTVYATDRATTRVADYRWQQTVDFLDVVTAGKPVSLTSAELAAAAATTCRPREVLVFGAASGMIHMALFAFAPVARVTVTCIAGVSHVPRPITPYEDMQNIWRISTMYNVTPENYAEVVDWLRRNRTPMILRTVGLTREDTGETILHALCGAVGDPRLAKLFVVNCARFLEVSREAHDGSTALHRLLANPGVCAPNNPRYFRCLELVELLVHGAAAPLDKQDSDGATVLHLACRGHRLDSKVLPRLLDAGGKMFASVRDFSGRNALDVAMDPASGLLPSEVAQVERLLALPGKPLITGRTLASIDRLPDISPSVAALTVGGRQLAAGGAVGGGAGAFADVVPDAVDRGDRSRPPLLNRAKLLAEFKRLDRDARGWLTLPEMKEAYQQYDHYGVVTSDSELDALMASLGISADGKVTFDEYVLLVLKLTRR